MLSLCDRSWLWGRALCPCIRFVCWVRMVGPLVGSRCWAWICWPTRADLNGCRIENVILILNPGRPGLVDQAGLVCQLPRATATERKLQQQVSATSRLGLPVCGLQAGKPGHLEIGTRSAPICEYTGPTSRSQHTKPTHRARLRNQCTHPKCSPGHVPLIDFFPKDL